MAGDEVSFDQIAQAYRRVKGKDPRYAPIPYWILARMGDTGKTLQWLRREGYRADIAALRAIYPGLKNLEDGLRAARPMPAPMK